MSTEGIQVVTFFMAMTTVLSWIAVGYVVVMVIVLFIDMYDQREEKSLLRISPSWRGVRIFKTTSKYQAKVWIPWEKMWEMARIGFALWRLK